MRFSFYHQHDSSDCGPACLKMVSAHYGKNIRIGTLRELSHVTRDGVSLLGISDAAEAIGFRTMGVNITYEEFIEQAPLPCIVHWKQRHFVVVYKIRKKGHDQRISVADPAHGKIKYNGNDFREAWCPAEGTEKKGICLLFEPTPELLRSKSEEKKQQRYKFLRPYIRPHLKGMLVLFALILAGSILQMVFPFLTQIIVDKGIRTKDIHFITLVLIGQLALFLGLLAAEFTRGWILLRISTRINIDMISGFLVKILRLPVGFFDSRMTGDLMQRISDQQRIQSFLTISSLNIVFASFTLLLLGGVLLYYNLMIFLVFCAGSLLYSAWIYLFMKRRRDLDYLKFSRMAENQENILEIITGMQEIKLHHCEEKKRRDWEVIQNQLFKISLESLKVNQFQNVGAFFFGRTKDILITFLTAWLVIRGEITLGMMLAVQYILGQMNGPVEQMVSFIREAQDASISMERLEEIHFQKEEEPPGETFLSPPGGANDIVLTGVGFQYEGPYSPWVLNDIDLRIPAKRVTAIVGSSGSGKTTLVKLLLGFYRPIKGNIVIGDTPLERISPGRWRMQCGTVLQDGFIFSDTLGANIALRDDKPDPARIDWAVRIANLNEMVESLPLKLETRIGMDGSGLSQGQKQRILIARAVYSNPDILFFDEATNALDTRNENVIMTNLGSFFRDKTVIIVAHRLSTVKNADQIIVLEHGRMAEAGNHDSLISRRGVYYELVKNQLELGY